MVIWRRLVAGIMLMVLPTIAWAAPDRLDALIRRQMRLSQLPGVAVAVIEHGRPVAVRTYGTASVEWAAPVTRDTRFQLASATKIVTGIVLMRLVERRRLSLDDPLTRWFPEAPPAWSGIRVRQLANHTSGLSDDLRIEGPRTVSAIVAAAERAPLAYAPGTQARYGFTDFTVLRAVIEKAGGKSLPQLVADEIATPLGLTATGFADASEDGPVRLARVLPRRAQTYGLRDGVLVTSDFFFEPAGYGAGGLFSSIDDLATLFAALDRDALLSAASLRELETPARLADGSDGGFGVGWVARRYRGVPVVGHSGGPALADILRVEDRKLTVVVLTNQNVFYPLLAEAVLDLYLGRAADPSAHTDDRPEVAARIRAILTGQAPAGTSDAITAPLATPFGQALLHGVGPVQGIEYLGQDAGKPCRTERSYRVRFRWQAMTWKAAVGCRGELLDLRPG